MWLESEEEEVCIVTWDNWSGVASRPLSDQIVNASFKSKFDDDLRTAVVSRSLSVGNLSEIVRPTVRRPDGHSTALGFGWIAATCKIVSWGVRSRPFADHVHAAEDPHTQNRFVTGDGSGSTWLIKINESN